MEKLNKNLIIGVLFIAAIVFGFMWYSQNQELNQLKISSSSPQAQTSQDITKDDSEERDTVLEQINEDFKTVDIWEKLQCTPKTRLDCGRTDCIQSEPVVYLVLDRPNKTFSRCDKKGCDSYDSIFGSSGMYTNIQSRDPRGMMVKVLGNREYIEMVTIGLSTVFQNGNCSEIR